MKRIDFDRCPNVIEKDGKLEACGGMLHHALDQTECIKCGFCLMDSCCYTQIGQKIEEFQLSVQRIILKHKNRNKK
ncbi:MAG: hypothetical protein ACXAC8_17700 [Candidatus Hodarchaeales archaeon]